MSEKRLDAELSLKGIIGFGIGLALIMVAVAALMWWLSLALREQAAANDPPLAALPEARLQELPPEPRLQSDPVGDLRRLREEETAALVTADWVDQDAGVARIPIAIAIEAVASSGLIPGTEEAAAEAGPVDSEVAP